MQWLVDLVIAAIGVPPCYVSRGDYGTNDFGGGHFITDGLWHTLDLSGIVPEGATAVKVHLRISRSVIPGAMKIRPHGYVGTTYRCLLRVQVANVDIGAFPVLGISADRKIDYLFTANNWVSTLMTVQGWWL